MDIGIFGATGTIGRTVVAEARRRGHRVTACTRSRSRVPAEAEGVTWKVADPTDLVGVAQAITGLDVVVNAINAGESIPDQIANAGVLPAAAAVLLKALEQRPSTRLIVIGGGGSLEIEPGVRLIDTGAAFDSILTDVLEVPVEYRKVVQAQVDVLDLCRLSNRNWTYISPSAGRIDSGERTGWYRIGGDQVIPGREGGGSICAEDIAAALLDEIEIPRHIQRRFTVGY
jgi:putative NADH-flavin reductase